MRFRKQTLLTCQKTAQTRAKSNIENKTLVRNDGKSGPTYQFDLLRNKATTLYVFEIERTTSVENKLFPIERYANVTHHLKFNRLSPERP